MVGDVIIDALLPGGGNSRRAMKTYRRGKPAIAQIIGIDYEHVRRNLPDDDGGSSGGPVMRLALQVQGAESNLNGVMQTLNPIDRVRLGQTVHVRVRKGRAVVAPDAGDGFQGDEPEAFCRRPANGISDDTLWDHVVSRNKDFPATITFTHAEANRKIASTRVRATAVVQGSGFDDFTATVDHLRLRPYASHLETLHYPLPGWARPGKRNPFIVDWAAAATHNPGVGAPPGYFRELITAAVSMDPLHGQLGAQSWSGQELLDAANASEPSGDVSFEQWATALAHCKVNKVRLPQQSEFVQQFGIPAERWSDLSAHWSTEMRSNPRLMIAVREIEKRVKQERKRS